MKRNLQMKSLVMKLGVICFNLLGRLAIKYWPSKTANSKRPVIAKCMLRVKKVLYAIFSGEGVAILVPVKKGKSFTRKYYKDVVLKKSNKCYQKRRPVTGFKRVQLLYHNTPAHTSAIVTNIFAKREGNSFTTPSLFTRPCLLIHQTPRPQKLKAFLAAWRYRTRQMLGSAIYQYLTSIPKSASCDAFQQWIHQLKLCISSHGDYFEDMK